VTNIFGPSLELESVGMICQKKAKLAIDAEVADMLNSE